MEVAKLEKLEKEHDEIKGSVAMIAKSIRENAEGIDKLNNFANEQGEKLSIINRRQDVNEHSITKIFNILEAQAKNGDMWQAESRELKQDIKSMVGGINDLRVAIEKVPLVLNEKQDVKIKRVHERIEGLYAEFANFKETSKEDHITIESRVEDKIVKRATGHVVSIYAIGAALAALSFNMFTDFRDEARRSLDLIRKSHTAHEVTDIAKHKELLLQLKSHEVEDNARHMEIIKDHAKFAKRHEEMDGE